MNLNHIKDKISHDFPLDKLISIDLHADMEEASIYLNMVAGNIIDEMNTKKKSRINEVLERVIEYINNHLAEDLTLTHLAEISYLNASYLSRVFKQEYQLNITEYIGKVRLEKAKTLLSGTACKINEIASQVGYLSVPSFNRVFKKAMGISPLEYRMKYGDKNNEI